MTGRTGRPRGRPTKRPRLEPEILGAIAAGKTFRGACLAVGLQYSSLKRWMRLDPALAARAWEARREAAAGGAR